MGYEQLTFGFVDSEPEKKKEDMPLDTWYDNEFILQDRIQKIQQIVRKYGEDNFSISFSGGKDSTVLHHLIDMALPGNRIPRVYANTGIELNMIRDFVLDMQKTDDRIVVIKPSVPIKPMLEKEGYPFKSKRHAQCVDIYQKHKSLDGRIGLQHYLHLSNDGVNWTPARSCPNILKYQFTEEFKLKVSDKCCLRLKEDPLHKWQKENNKPHNIVGIMRDEGGRRDKSVCMAWKNSKKNLNFQPLVPVTKEWEQWFIDTYHVKICDIYYPPYNFERTGCKGCPFNPKLQKDLDTLERFFPAERKQCEIIWGPVYEEYRRLGYRLRENGEDQLEGQMNIFELSEE